jgi:hypothetical protein
VSQCQLDIFLEKPTARNSGRMDSTTAALITLPAVSFDWPD